MKITSVRVNCKDATEPAADGTVLLAFASIVLDGDFVVSHIRVVESPGGRRIVAMPSRATPSGSYRDVAYALSEELRREIRHEVLDAVARA